MIDQKTHCESADEIRLADEAVCSDVRIIELPELPEM